MVSYPGAYDICVPLLNDVNFDVLFLHYISTLICSDASRPGKHSTLHQTCSAPNLTSTNDSFSSQLLLIDAKW